MAKHATMIHTIFRPTKSGNPVNKQKRLDSPSNKAISQTPATGGNRKPSDRIWGGV